MQHELTAHSEQLESFKTWFMAVAKNQKLIADRIATWPFITTPSKKDEET